ncbi:MAG: redoxin domain-containing protein [Clostridia bacterium]|nr:redoxin domain-containing protein [Deltaproteobacteria bacterium]
MRVGVAAPDFSSTDASGESFAVSNYRGSPMLLSFYRYAACPLCNLRLHDLTGRWPDLAKRGLVGAAVFQSPVDSIKVHLTGHGERLRLIPDQDETLYALYGLEKSLAAFLSPKNLPRLVTAHRAGFPQRAIEGSFTRLPADFLIDGDGIVRVAHYGQTLYDHIGFDVIDQFLNDYPPH